MIDGADVLAVRSDDLHVLLDMYAEIHFRLLGHGCIPAAKTPAAVACSMASLVRLRAQPYRGRPRPGAVAVPRTDFQRGR